MIRKKQNLKVNKNLYERLFLQKFILKIVAVWVHKNDKEGKQKEKLEKKFFFDRSSLKKIILETVTILRR